jgi:serine/threonine protein phosphatase PrpC
VPLRVSAGQYSDKGRQPANQDFHGLRIPAAPQLAAKGAACAIADGISSSATAQHASQAAVHSFLADYYCTSDAWSVKKSVERVLAAANSWLYAQTQAGAGRYDRDRGWVCTLSAIVLKSRTAHLFHVGDARIYQLQGRRVEQLTQDHRVAVGGGQSYLGRALGVNAQVEIDYRTIALEPGDTFVLATDGVHEHVRETAMVEALAAHRDDLDAAARAIAEAALANGSEDNLTVQVLRVDALPQAEAGELSQLAAQLPLPPLLEPRALFDGFRIVRELHASSRSHVYLAVDEETQETVVLKTPSIDLQGDAGYVERFLLEEWVARRVDSPHVLKSRAPARPRNFLYVVMEYVEGRSLRQWMVDHPPPDLETVRGLLEQVGRGLRALHRLEMAHQDLRPENVIVDATGTARIIDFAAVRVAGIAETDDTQDGAILGTAQYTAPELFLGQPGSARADLFALAVTGYEMLTGALPYGARVAQCRTPAQQRRLAYRPVTDTRRDVPDWVDEALRKALAVEPARRWGDVAEFTHALHRPDPDLPRRRRLPLIERNPVVFWKGVSLALALVCLFLLSRIP